MNSISKFILFTLLLGFTAVASGQEDAEFRKQMREQLRKQRDSKTVQEMEKQRAKNSAKYLWNEKVNHSVFNFALDAEFRKELGITEEQYAELNKGRVRPQNDPKMREFTEKIAEFYETLDSEGPFMDNAPLEKRREFLKLHAEMQQYIFEEKTAKIEKTITPEQMRKSREIQIATMGELPFVSPDVFEALDLSDDQRKHLDRIQKELEPEFEKKIDRSFDSQMKIRNKIDEYQDRNEIDVDWSKPVESSLIMEEIEKKVLAENPDLRKELNESLDDLQTFTTRLKFQMFDVLTDEQMDRMSELINNPPDYIRKIRDRMRAYNKQRRGSSLAGFDIDVWKPGDPIPEEYIQKRKSGRFPGK